MDHSSLPIYHHPSMTMGRPSDIGPVPGSIPLNFPMNNPAQINVGEQGATMSQNNGSFTQTTQVNKMSAQQQNSQLPLRKEVDEEGKIRAAVLLKNPAHLSAKDNDVHRHFLYTEENEASQVNAKENNVVQLPKEENDDGMFEETENKEDIINFMETAHDIFLKISIKELKIQEASEILGRSFAFTYSRYQEFCDNITGKNTTKKKKEAKMKENRKKKRRPKKLTISKRSEKVYQCPDCPAIFYTAYLFKKHCNVNHSENVYQCPDCPATFATDYLLKTHSKVHLENNESHLCTSCGRVFSKIGQLMRHRLDIHGDALQCPHCDKQYTNIKSYQSHIVCHKTNEDRPFKCEECGKGFFSRTSLEQHYLVHTGLKPFMCGNCEKTYKSIKDLTIHYQKVHTEEGSKPKICTHCGKSFKSIKSLVIHQRVHTKAKPQQNFECNICGRIFKKKYNLEQHERTTHSGEKPHACDLCNSRFSLKADLNRHRRKHAGENPFKCNYCSAAFYSKVDLERHDMAHTGIKPFKCTLCDYSCIKKPSMEYHMNTHTGKTPFKCDFYGCSAEFASPSTFRLHKSKHFPPPLKRCKLCNEKFPDANSLKHHMPLHTGNKPLSCDQCEKIFYTQSSLNRHVLVHINKPQGNKPKQVRQRKRNPGVKRADKSETIKKKFTSEYEVPIATENGQSSFNQSWTIGAQGINNHQSLHPHFPPSQYTNLNAWPSTMGPDELRQRLLDSFK